MHNPQLRSYYESPYKRHLLTFSSSIVCRESWVKGGPLEMVKSMAHTILMTQFPLT